MDAQPQNQIPNQQVPVTQSADLKRDISAQVLAKVDSFQKSGELMLPKDYVVENALKSAYIILSDPKNNLLTKCDKSSVAEALLKMVVYGVSPIKKQCYFIPYGNKLECSVSYAGNIAIAKRYGRLKAIKANAIFEGDNFEFEVDAATGRRKVIKHSQSLDSIGNSVLKGAYAVYELTDGTSDVEIMNIKQIQAAWGQGGSKGNSPAHKNFADQMAIKTVINRACKLLISSSDDSILYDPLEENDYVDTTKGRVQQEINDNANGDTLGFDNYDDAEILDEQHEEIINAHNEVVQQEADQITIDGPGF